MANIADVKNPVTGGKMKLSIGNILGIFIGSVVLMIIFDYATRAKNAVTGLIPFGNKPAAQPTATATVNPYKQFGV